MARTQPGCYGQPELNNPHIHNQGLPILFLTAFLKAVRNQQTFISSRWGEKGKIVKSLIPIYSSTIQRRPFFLTEIAL